MTRHAGAQVRRQTSTPPPTAARRKPSSGGRGRGGRSAGGGRKSAAKKPGPVGRGARAAGRAASRQESLNRQVRCSAGSTADACMFLTCNSTVNPEQIMF